MWGSLVWYWGELKIYTVSGVGWGGRVPCYSNWAKLAHLYLIFKVADIFGFCRDSLNVASDVSLRGGGSVVLGLLSAKQGGSYSDHMSGGRIDSVSPRGDHGDHTDGGRNGELLPKGLSKRTSPVGYRCATIPQLKSIRALHDASAGWSSGLTIQTSQYECVLAANHIGQYLE